MKFHLAYKDLTSPVFFARVAGWAAVQQATTLRTWPRCGRIWQAVGGGPRRRHYGKLIGNAILPSLLHQDPRYFYQGTGTKWSRARHAILAPLVCKGDNGESQPNYSLGVAH